MRNKIVFLTIMSILILNGCRSVDSDKTESEPESTTVESEITVSESETITKEQETVVAEYEINSTGCTLYDELIENIMSIYYTSEDKLDAYSAIDVSYCYASGELDKRGGYALMDLDGDGVEELLLGDTEFNEHIFNIFTIKDNRLVAVYQNESPKEETFLCKDKIIYTVFSFNSDNWWCDYFNYANGQLNAIESIWENYDSKESHIDDGYVYYQTGDSEEVLITEEEMDTIMNKYEKVEIGYSPLVKSVLQ